MLVVSSLIAVALAWGPAPARPRRVENPKLAVRLLQLRHPDISWREPAVRADFNGDQISDLAILGTNPRTLVVAVVVGPVDGGAKTVRVWWEGEHFRASCMRDAVLAVEEVDSPQALDASQAVEATNARLAGVKGLRLGAPACDVIHIYWDRRNEKLNWWRRQ